MKKYRLSLVFFGILFSAMAFGQSHYPGQHPDKLKIVVTAPMKTLAFDLKIERYVD